MTIYTCIEQDLTGAVSAPRVLPIIEAVTALAVEATSVVDAFAAQSFITVVQPLCALVNI